MCAYPGDQDLTSQAREMAQKETDSAPEQATHHAHCPVVVIPDENA